MRLLKLKRLEQEKSSRLKAAKRMVKKMIPAVLIVSLLTGAAVFLATLSGSSVVNYIVHGSLLKSVNGRVNILLLGIAGGTHDGANLTDTILVASYDLKTNNVALISIPRDLWLPEFKGKANAVYETGLDQHNGLGLSKTVMGNVIGLPIRYALRLDFRGFVKAIDAVGGLDVEVDKSFDDYNYPIDGKEDDMCGYQEKEMDISAEDAKKLNIDPGKQKLLVAPDGTIATDSAKEDMGAKYFTCRYEHLQFTKGLTHMDGTMALKFVRSRHGTNGEGSDFARSKRQQKTLEAFRSKVLSFETLTDASKISELLQTFGKSIDTDISVKESVELYRLSKKMGKISDLVLDDSPKTDLPNGRTSLLYHPSGANYGGAYVLISQDDDFSSVQQYVRKVLSQINQKNEQVLSNGNEASATARTGDR